MTTWDSSSPAALGWTMSLFSCGGCWTKIVDWFVDGVICGLMLIYLSIITFWACSPTFCVWKTALRRCEVVTVDSIFSLSSWGSTPSAACALARTFGTPRSTLPTLWLTELLISHRSSEQAAQHSLFALWLATTWSSHRLLCTFAFET